MSAEGRQLVRRVARLVSEVAADQGRSRLLTIADRAEIPISTAHRLVAALQREGVFVRASHGRYLLGPKFFAMAHSGNFRSMLQAVARPVLGDLAKASGLAVHLGVFENEMVTYLLKCGRHTGPRFTRADMALEAYCTGIGKALLAHLPPAELNRYLAGGPFVRLTPNTVTDPEELRSELVRARHDGYAVDDAEMDPEIRCVAMPVSGAGETLCAISISAAGAGFRLEDVKAHLPKLAAATARVAAILAGDHAG